MNYKITIASVVLLLLAFSAKAQTATEVLQSISQNNTTLRSLREGASADKLENQTGINLKNPEVEYIHKWGSPDEVQDLTEVSVMQTFDYATVFGLKRKMARSQNELVDIELRQQELSVILQAKELLVNIVYANRLHHYMDIRVAQLQTLVSQYQKALEAGEVSKLDVSKARLTLSEVLTQQSMVEVEHQSLHAALKAMNGGQPIMFTDTIYPSTLLSSAITSTALLADQRTVQLSIADQEIRTAKADGLPELSMGYVAEYTKAEKLRGLGVSVSIPLWSNHNNVRRAKARKVAQDAAIDDATHQLNAQKEDLEIRAKILRSTADTAYKMLDDADNDILLLRALKLGEISLLDYIMEIQTYYTLMQEAMETERDYWLTMVRLSAI